MARQPAPLIRPAHENSRPQRSGCRFPSRAPPGERPPNGQGVTRRGRTPGLALFGDPSVHGRRRCRRGPARPRARRAGTGRTDRARRRLLRHRAAPGLAMHPLLWWTTTMLHTSGDAFDAQLQFSQLRWVTSSEAGARSRSFPATGRRETQKRQGRRDRRRPPRAADKPEPAWMRPS
jgi:hypothetical protein